MVFKTFISYTMWEGGGEFFFTEAGVSKCHAHNIIMPKNQTVLDRFK